MHGNERDRRKDCGTAKGPSLSHVPEQKPAEDDSFGDAALGEQTWEQQQPIGAEADLGAGDEDEKTG